MAPSEAAVKSTANFEANLKAIADFWTRADGTPAFETLLDELDVAIGHLEQHPLMGRRFFARSAASVEVKNRVRQLQVRLGAIDVREYLCGDYLLLYCVVPLPKAGRPTLYLLAIRHHRQLSFDFDGFWRANSGDGT